MSEVPLSESVTNPSPTPETEELKPQRKGVLISRTSGAADIKGAVLKNEEIKQVKERKTSNKKARAVGVPPKRRSGSPENVSSYTFAKKEIDPTLEPGQINVVSDLMADSGFKVTAPTAKELAEIRVTKRAPLRGEKVNEPENLLTISYPLEGATDGRGSRQILRIEVSDSGEISVAEEKPSETSEVASPRVTRPLREDEVPPTVVSQIETTPSTTPAMPEAALPKVTRVLGPEEVPPAIATQIETAPSTTSVASEVASPNVTRPLTPEEVPPAIGAQMETTPSTTPATPEAASPNVTRPLNESEVSNIPAQPEPEAVKAEKVKTEKHKGILWKTLAVGAAAVSLATALLGGGRGEQAPGAAMSTPTPEKTATVISTLTGDTGAGADLGNELAGDRTEGRMRIHKTVQTETAAPVVPLEKSTAVDGETLTGDADQLLEKLIPDFAQLPDAARFPLENLVANYMVTENVTQGPDYELTLNQEVNKLSLEQAGRLVDLLTSKDPALANERKAAEYVSGKTSNKSAIYTQGKQSYFAGRYIAILNRYMGSSK